MLNRNDLHAYQRKAIEFFKTKKRCALFLDMGLGKTTSCLTAVLDLLNEGAIAKILIIAPLRVANTTWVQEIEKWSHLNGLKAVICTGNEKQRREAFASRSEVYVINRENVEWLISSKLWDFDCVIIDESSSFKNPTSKRFKALKKPIMQAEYVAILSGTPSPQGLLDLWSQIFLIDGGERLGRTMGQYKMRFFKPVGYMGYQYEPIDGAAEIIQTLLKDICLTMNSEDYLDLPECLNHFEYIELPPKAAKQYKELKKEMLLELENGTSISSPTAAALNGKLLQICNGAVYIDCDDVDEKTDRPFEIIHEEKIQALKEMVENNPNENLLVAYYFKHDLQRLKEAFPEAVVLDKNAETVERWNAGKIKMLLAHPMSAGHGLNLQHGGNTLVYFSLTWSLECYQQFNKRLHRQGQKNCVKIIHLVTKGGVDEAVLTALANKAKTQNDLLNALKEHFLK